MSDMTPVAYTSDCDLARIHKGRAGDISCSPDSGGKDAPDTYPIPLCTEGQLSEAVAAERERCAKVCESLAPSMGHGTWVESACKNCAEAIRSAAK